MGLLPNPNTTYFIEIERRFGREDEPIRFIHLLDWDEKRIFSIESSEDVVGTYLVIGDPYEKR